MALLLRRAVAAAVAAAYQSAFGDKRANGK